MINLINSYDIYFKLHFHHYILHNKMNKIRSYLNMF
jgi:hypothetical protein